MKNVDYRLNGKLGFYQQGHNFVNFSFDTVKGEYFIQYGYVRPNGTAQERIGATRCLVQGGSILNQIENSLNKVML